MWANVQRDGALPNTGGAHCSTPQSLANAHTRVPCNNAGNTRNLLKFARVPQTPEMISVVSGPKFAILWRHVEDISMFNVFFRLSTYALIAKTQPDKVVRWCADGDFLRHFCVLYFQRAACSTFHTCILNSH